MTNTIITSTETDIVVVATQGPQGPPGSAIGAATAPLNYDSGTQTISITAATTSAAGSMSATDKTKLDGIAAGAEVNVNADWNAGSGDAQILNKPTLGTAAATAATDYAPAAQGVTNGNSHDHNGGDGAQIAYSSLSGLPTLGTAAAKNTGTAAGNVVELDGSARLPAVDGSQLTGINTAGTDPPAAQILTHTIMR